MLFNISVAFVSVIKNGNPKNKPHALSEIILLPWKRQQALDFVEKYLKDILLLSDLNKEDEKGLVAVILSKLISAADTGKDDSLKPIKTRAQITINSWLQSSDTDMNIKALSALSCVLLADAELGVDIFLSEVQSIVEAIDGLEFEKPHVKDAIQLITAGTHNTRTATHSISPLLLLFAVVVLNSYFLHLSLLLVPLVCCSQLPQKTIALIFFFFCMQNNPNRNYCARLLSQEFSESFREKHRATGRAVEDAAVTKARCHCESGCCYGKACIRYVGMRERRQAK